MRTAILTGHFCLACCRCACGCGRAILPQHVLVWVCKQVQVYSAGQTFRSAFQNQTVAVWGFKATTVSYSFWVRAHGRRNGILSGVQSPTCAGTEGGITCFSFASWVDQAVRPSCWETKATRYCDKGSVICTWLHTNTWTPIILAGADSHCWGPDRTDSP